MVTKTATMMAAATGVLASMGTAFAAQPYEWQIWHQEPASEIMRYVEWFDFYTLYFIVPITLFVMGLLLYVMIKFRKGANPVPSKTSHNSTIEAVWTVVPILILVALALPSFDLLNRQYQMPSEPTVTIKATGQTWYWDYAYMDESGVDYSSNMLPNPEDDEDGARAELQKASLEEYPRLLAVDNEMVVPVNETIRVLVTAEATGVIHNFALPAFGLKMDAIPGRVNETWFKAEREGLYYGQCSELCGKNHSFMPIAIRVVSRPQYEAWLNAAGDDVENANRDLMASIEDARNTKLAQTSKEQN